MNKQKFGLLRFRKYFMWLSLFLLTLWRTRISFFSSFWLYYHFDFIPSYFSINAIPVVFPPSTSTWIENAHNFCVLQKHTESTRLLRWKRHNFKDVRFNKWQTFRREHLEITVICSMFDVLFLVEHTIFLLFLFLILFLFSF